MHCWISNGKSFQRVANNRNHPIYTPDKTLSMGDLAHARAAMQVSPYLLTLRNNCIKNTRIGNWRLVIHQTHIKMPSFACRWR